MTTRSSHRWQNPPPDYLNTNHLLPSTNKYGIPDLLRTQISLPRWLIPYRHRVRTNDLPDGGCTHFFSDDYQFNSVWTQPHKALQYLCRYPLTLTPDFSLYRDWPLAIQLWNVYRNRWCGRFWQEKGLTVIPTISWSTAESYDFCFAGVFPGSPVAIATVGVNLNDPLIYTFFMDGFRAMLSAIAPTWVLSYGNLPAECQCLVPCHIYPTRWTGIRQARQQGGQSDGRSRRNE